MLKKKLPIAVAKGKKKSTKIAKKAAVPAKKVSAGMHGMMKKGVRK